VKIAFITLNAYDILTGGHGGTAGGAQLQQVLIAREFVAKGHDVYFVEHEADLKTEAEVDGITIVTKPKPSGNFVSRAFQASSGTFSVLKEIDPDVCYFRVLDFEIFPTVLYCKLFGSAFVYGFSHDNEVTRDPNSLTGPIKSSTPYLYLMRAALSAADALIAQNDFQYDNATRLFDAETYLVPNGYIDPDVEPDTAPPETPMVLWVSRFRSFKRPELVLEIAKQVPNARFVLIGSKNNEALYDRIVDAAAAIDNVEVVGYVPYDEINDYFETCDVFLNTSKSEGFPNTFLQAWAHRKPVVSLDVDPNDIIATNEMGFCADDSVDDLVEQLQEIVDDDASRRAMGDAAYEYFTANHSIESVATEYERVFETVSQ
jgi:glycosyltransferase involved in cell wall biosynthesis